MKIRIVERAKKTVSKEISSQMKKGKPHDQAVAIAMSKKEKGEIVNEAFDHTYLRRQGLKVGKKLGEGMFGQVFSVTGKVGGKEGEYALKFVKDSSPGYAREKRNYQNIKKFVDLANVRQDAEAMSLSKILPVIYSVSEHDNALYIVMEKLLPLSEDEKNLFMSEISGLAYHYSQKGRTGRGNQLIDYIIDRDGDVGLSFDSDMATAITKAVARAPEYNHLKSDIEGAKNRILGGGTDFDYTKVMRAWQSGGMVDDIKHDAIDELYRSNKEFKKFFQGVSSLLVSQYKGDKPEEKLTDDGGFVGMLLGSIFDIVFSQKYPMKYVKDPDSESPYQTGYGQSSDIYDADVVPNPKLKEQKRQYDVSGVQKNPAQKGGEKMKPQKYPFDPIISAIKRLGRDWNIGANDMHNANVMKRADGQFVIADIGLFNTKLIQSMKSGIFESKKRKIKVKII